MHTFDILLVVTVFTCIVIYIYVSLQSCIDLGIASFGLWTSDRYTLIGQYNASQRNKDISDIIGLDSGHFYVTQMITFLMYNPRWLWNFPIQMFDFVCDIWGCSLFLSFTILRCLGLCKLVLHQCFRYQILCTNYPEIGLRFSSSMKSVCACLTSHSFYWIFLLL